MSEHGHGGRNPLDGRVAVVTGAASGLGEATARMLAGQGVKVAIFDMQKERGEAVAKDIGGVFCEGDVTNEASVEAALAKARAAHGVERGGADVGRIDALDRAEGDRHRVVGADLVEQTLTHLLAQLLRIVQPFRHARRIEDHRGGDHDTAGLIETVNHAGLAVVAVDVGLAHRGDQEDLVVHR